MNVAMESVICNLEGFVICAKKLLHLNTFLKSLRQPNLLLDSYIN